VVVDDDGVALAMMTSSLRKRGYHVVSYGDPREAVKQVAIDLPAAVITDMRMPHMSGLDVVREVRERLGTQAPPVIVISANDEEEHLSEAFRLGASDYLLKPVSEAELGVKLERALKPSEKRPGFDSVPEKIGPWKVHECIGRGGTACVFSATRPGDPTTYALKVVWPHLLSSTETLLRFRREIDTLSELDHPRLVKFIESGRHGDWFYYVMHHVAGGSLRQRVRDRGPLTAEDALRVIEQVAEPLGYLHARGLVHRDVKPGNIYYDRHDEAVLGDFGLARRLPDRGITLSSEFIGTPLYLAPEVFRSPEFDATVDLYALGVSAFEALLGRAPLSASDSMGLIGRIIDHGLPSPRDLVPGLPEDLYILLERLMARLPAARPRSAEEVVAMARRARGV
jgi:serine/threonine protein kinase